MKFTPSQVLDMAIESRLNDRLRLDSEASRILSVQCLERFATLAADRALEAAAQKCDVTPPQPFRPSIEAAHAVRAMKEQQ